jgi:hypothetical protein
VQEAVEQEQVGLAEGVAGFGKHDASMRASWCEIKLRRLPLDKPP